jgi:ribosomal protein S8
MGRIITKKDKVLDHLKTYGTITPLEAMEKYNSMRLSAIIFDLKKEGHQIETNLKRTKKSNYAVYSMKRR